MGAYNYKNETDNRYGRLLVLRRVGRDKQRNVIWECQCDCGQTTKTLATNLRRGSSKSCGCLQKEVAAEKATKHGMANHPLYSCWKDIRRRCCIPHSENYQHYGGRGIQLYGPWQDVKEFIEWIEKNIGPRPKGHSLDRMDVHGNYEPGNLRWATQLEQNRNRTMRVVSKEEEGILALLKEERKLFEPPTLKLERMFDDNSGSK